MVLAVWVKLQYCSCAYAETVVEGLEKLAASLERIIGPLTGHTEPLDGRNTDGSIEDPRSNFPSLANINLPEPPSNPLRTGNIKHISTNINPLPEKPILCKRLPREPRPASDIQDEGSGLQVQQLDGTLGDMALNVLDARVGLVFGGLVDVVVDIWGKLILWSAAHYILIYYIL